MNQVVALAEGKHGAEHCVAHAEALALARASRLQAARLSSNRAMDLALQEGQRETAASYRVLGQSPTPLIYSQSHNTWIYELK